MVQKNGQIEANRKGIRKGFLGFLAKQWKWVNKQFELDYGTCKVSFYPEAVRRYLRLASVDETVARSVVDEEKEREILDKGYEDHQSFPGFGKNSESLMTSKKVSLLYLVNISQNLNGSATKKVQRNISQNLGGIGGFGG